MTRDSLLMSGISRVMEFCDLNKMRTPSIMAKGKSPTAKHCAYYRRDTGITIYVPSCAAPGYGGRAWSWPGYIIDRTPYGVLAHELGHHADNGLSSLMRKASGEKPLTGYAPNDAEWFAEMFRLFVTNSELLKLVRPRAYSELIKHFKTFHENWKTVLKQAPARTVAMAERRIKEAA
jgi:hypothetical protein